LPASGFISELTRVALLQTCSAKVVLGPCGVGAPGVIGLAAFTLETTCLSGGIVFDGAGATFSGAGAVPLAGAVRVSCSGATDASFSDAVSV
jgi:hypothetical protein